MSVKNTAHVEQYVTNIVEMQRMLADLQKFVESLPAPDDAGELPTLHYGHTGDVRRTCELIQRAHQTIGEFWKQ